MTRAEQDGGDVDALRRWTAFNAELQTFSPGSLLGDVSGQFGGKSQVATDLANDQSRAQMAGVNFHVTSRFLVDDPDGNQMLKRR